MRWCAHGREHPASGDVPNVVGGARKFRSKRHDAYRTVSGGLPAFELVDAGCPELCRVVRAARAILGRQVRPFDMHPQHGVPRPRVLVARRGDNGERMRYPILGGSHDRREESGHATTGLAADQFVDHRRVEVGPVDVETGVSVYLEVDHARNQPPAGCLRVRLDSGDLSTRMVNANAAAARHSPGDRSVHASPRGSWQPSAVSAEGSGCRGSSTRLSTEWT